MDRRRRHCLSKRNSAKVHQTNYTDRMFNYCMCCVTAVCPFTALFFFLFIMVDSSVRTQFVQQDLN